MFGGYIPHVLHGTRIHAYKFGLDFMVFNVFQKILRLGAWLGDSGVQAYLESLDVDVAEGEALFRLLQQLDRQHVCVGQKGNGHI